MPVFFPTMLGKLSVIVSSDSFSIPSSLSSPGTLVFVDIDTLCCPRCPLNWQALGTSFIEASGEWGGAQEVELR